MRHILWHLLAGTRGGPMRAKLLRAITTRPDNMNQLAERLGVDYKTVQHHIELLEKHRAVHKVGGGYGATYHITPELDAHKQELETIWERTGDELEKTS